MMSLGIESLAEDYEQRFSPYGVDAAKIWAFHKLAGLALETDEVFDLNKLLPEQPVNTIYGDWELQADSRYPNHQVPVFTGATVF